MKIGLGFFKEPEGLDYISTFKDTAGLEGEFIIEKGNVNFCELSLFDCNLSEEEFVSKFYDDSELHHTATYIYILSQEGKILDALYTGGIELLECVTDKDGKLNIVVGAYLHGLSRGSYDIIKKRLNHEINDLGFWKNLTDDNLMGWLEVAATLSTYEKDVANKVVTIEGTDFDCEDKFYCALGVGGYFGSNLDALHECFCGDFGVKGEFTLIWKNHKMYKDKFPYKYGK